MRILFSFYRYLISPAIHLLAGAGSGCKFEPTCSHYAEQAVHRHGVLFGSWLALKRLLKCHPFSKASGLDPVPENFFVLLRTTEKRGP